MAINSRTNNPRKHDAGAFDVGVAAAATGVGTLLTISFLTAPLPTLLVLIIASSTTAVVSCMDFGPSPSFFSTEEDPDDYVPGAAAWELENPPRPWEETLDV